MKIVHWLDGDASQGIVIVDTTADDGNMEVAEVLPMIVGIGNVYYAFASLAENIEANIGWNPNGAAVCSSNVDENRQAIRAMLDNPPLNKVFAAS